MTNLSSHSKAVMLVAIAGLNVMAFGIAQMLLGPDFSWHWTFLAAPIGMVTTILYLAAAAWYVQRIARGIHAVSAVCVQAFQGNLEPRIVGRRDAGDLGVLQASVNDMLDIVDAFVREASASMEYVSRGKCFRKVLTRGLPGAFKAGAVVINGGTDAMDEKVRTLARTARGFGSRMEAVANGLSTAASALSEDAQTMSGAAHETNAQSTAVAAASEQASVNVQTVASAAEELSSSIAEISRQVTASTGVTTKAVQEARRTNDLILTLAGSAKQIGEVVKLISEIAGQTNLLALNATIEAARAGEMGKGFAVVAAEVKNLANQTARATEEIAGKIAEMQQATDNSVAAVNAINLTINQVSEISTSIASAVEEQGAATREIARNVQEASTGTAEVSANVVGISEAAAATGRTATRVQDASHTIVDEIETLRVGVAEFLDVLKAS